MFGKINDEDLVLQAMYKSNDPKSLEEMVDNLFWLVFLLLVDAIGEQGEIRQRKWSGVDDHYYEAIKQKNLAYGNMASSLGLK